MNPPEIIFDVRDLEKDSVKRHEALVDLLGQYIMWLRSSAIDRSRRIIGESDGKDWLGLVRWKRFEGVAELTSEEQAAACDFAEATVDRFIELLLTLFAGTGVDQRIGPCHAVRFRLDIEVLDVETGEVALSETVNRGGKKFFASYWGRWLNRATSVKPTSSSQNEERERQR